MYQINKTYVLNNISLHLKTKKSPIFTSLREGFVFAPYVPTNIIFTTIKNREYVVVKYFFILELGEIVRNKMHNTKVLSNIGIGYVDLPIDSKEIVLME